MASTSGSWIASVGTTSTSGSWIASAGTTITGYYEEARENLRSSFELAESEERARQKFMWKEPQKPRLAPLRIPSRKYPHLKTFTGLRFRVGGSKK